MIYQSEFCDLLYGKTFTIRIDNHIGNNNIRSFKLGSSPFVVQMKSDGKHVYAPLKTTGATIQMLHDTYDFSLYTGQATGTNVNLYGYAADQISANTIPEWSGYLTPCMYDMDFDNPWEVIELEAVDGIAVLKDVPYKSISEEHGVQTFLDIIANCLHLGGIYDQIYCSKNVQLTSPTSNERILEKLRISEENFFDKKKDMNQTDDDVAWSCYDVLYELMQYLGYTMIPALHSVIIYDVDEFISIPSNKMPLFCSYQINNAGKATLSSDAVYVPNFNSKRTINADSYIENGTKLGLDDVYNKVTVTDKFYTYDNLFPTFGDINFETNITDNTNTNLASLLTSGSHYKYASTIARKNNKGADDNLQCFIADAWRTPTKVFVVKFYDSPVLEFKKYSNKDTNRNEITNESSYNWGKMSWNKIMQAHGATYCRLYSKEIDFDDAKKWYNAHSGNINTEAAWKEIIGGVPSNVKCESLIIGYNGPNNHIGPGWGNTSGRYNDITDNEDCKKYPFIQLREGKAKTFGGAGAYVVISGKFSYHDEYTTPFPMTDVDRDKLKRKQDLKDEHQFYFWCMFRWGNNWWNGSDWQSTACQFKLYWRNRNLSRDERKNKTHYAQEYEFIDTAQSVYGKEVKGLYIPLADNNLNGPVEFVIYCNRDMSGDSRRSHWHADGKVHDNFYERYYSYCVFLKDLKIQAYIDDGLANEEERNSDTSYTNVIENGSVKKMDTINFKVCTYDNKKPTYSAVDYLDNSGNSHYVKYTYNKILNKSEHIGNPGLQLTQEEHLVFKLVSQYEEPKIKFTANLKMANSSFPWLAINPTCPFTDTYLGPAHKFMIDEMTLDYKNSTQQVQLIEIQHHPQ